MQIVPAALGDLGPIGALLDELGLPTAGIADQFPNGYVTAIRDGQLIGCAGLETYGGAGLLRSVAVRRVIQRSGVGRALVADRIAAATSLGLDAVYLLTTTAADYFPRIGFVPIHRADVPPALAASPEFASVCPASAAGFMLRL
jgi:amino-acid N-acetyltransferase